jgi:hypothetical protein
VWALRVQCASEAGRYRELLLRTVPLAVELRHEPFLEIRDGGEVLCGCT